VEEIVEEVAIYRCEYSEYNIVDVEEIAMRRCEINVEDASNVPDEKLVPYRFFDFAVMTFCQVTVLVLILIKVCN